MAWWTLKHGKLEDHFSVPAGGLHPQHLVIVLPPEFREFDVAHRILEKLLRRLSPRTCTVLVRDGFRTWLSSDLGVRVVAFDPSAHNWLGFPKPQLVRRVKEIGADAAIDLTPGFNPFTAALAAATAAPVRVSLDCGRHNQFCNYFIQMDEAKSLPERYDALLQYV